MKTILLIELSGPSYDDIYDRAVSKRRPRLQRLGGDKAVYIGERGYLIPFNDDTCGQGLALITLRSNVVMVVITCGARVDEDHILHIGQIMDRRVQLPPMVKHVQKTLLPDAAITLPPPEMSQDEQCRRFNLTPEEGANAGRQTYGAVFTKMTGPCEPAEAFTCTFNNDFSESGLIQAYICIHSEGSSNGTSFLSKSGKNKYMDVRELEDGYKLTYTYIFTLTGFNLKTLSVSPAGVTCKSEFTFNRQ